jgi:hypothetical protein
MTSTKKQKCIIARKHTKPKAYTYKNFYTWIIQAYRKVAVDY